ncbi:MAG: redoxin domain-containing protein [Pirellulales bacterium]|nr:redoxin domain-containing protein [Pirellulales bacterium]
MKVRIYVQWAVGLFALSAPLFAGVARGANPSAEQALQLAPIQKDVDFSQPTPEEVAKCKIRAEKGEKGVGWVVEDPNGLTLRRFFDTNGDNVVDQWAYFKDGLEVYRDIDSDSNGKADQYRWFHTEGSRWATDKNEDGKIDAWKAISAEEATAEVVAALASRDAERFAQVALTSSELQALGLGQERTKQLAEKLDGLTVRFGQLAAQQKTITPATKWIQFSGNQPGVVPAGTGGATKDLRVYENVVAIVETGGEHGQVPLGTLIEVGPVWKVIDLPILEPGKQAEVAAGFFFQTPMANREPMAAGTSGDEEGQKFLAELEKLDAVASRAGNAEETARFNAKRADLLEQIAEKATKPEDRAMWLRQLADMVGAAVQSGGYPEGADRLEALFEKLQKNPQDQELAAYVKFRQLTADYGLSVVAPNADFAKIQTEWLKKLEDYVATYPKSPDAAEALLQLGIAQEFAGQEEDAKKWFGQIVDRFPDSPTARKAAGARKRLDSVGKTIEFQGKSPAGGMVDLASYRGKVVLVHYWATWCEPCKQDMATIQDLLGKYGRSGFASIGVNLDNTVQEMASYVNQNRIAWPQIYEEGGLESRPANELGILTLPTMLLIDQQGRVVNRNVQTAELDRELKRLVR